MFKTIFLYFSSIAVILLISGCSALLGSDVTPSCSRTELPAFLEDVWPSPAEVMSVEAYHETKQTPPYLPTSGLGIGFVIWPHEIDRIQNLAQDANNATQYYSEKSTLYLNGNEVSKDNFSYGSGIVGGQAFDEDGNSLSFDAGPYYMQWFTPLTPGNYEAEFNLVNKDGKSIKFAWCFTITNN